MKVVNQKAEQQRAVGSRKAYMPERTNLHLESENS